MKTVNKALLFTAALSALLFFSGDNLAPMAADQTVPASSGTVVNKYTEQRHRGETIHFLHLDNGDVPTVTRKAYYNTQVGQHVDLTYTERTRAFLYWIVFWGAVFALSFAAFIANALSDPWSKI